MSAPVFVELCWSSRKTADENKLRLLLMSAVDFSTIHRYRYNVDSGLAYSRNAAEPCQPGGVRN
jgi:hypothetical protein